MVTRLLALLAILVGAALTAAICVGIRDSAAARSCDHYRNLVTAAYQRVPAVWWNTAYFFAPKQLANGAEGLDAYGRRMYATDLARAAKEFPNVPVVSPNNSDYVMNNPWVSIWNGQTAGRVDQLVAEHGC